MCSIFIVSPLDPIKCEVFWSCIRMLKIINFVEVGHAAGDLHLVFVLALSYLYNHILLCVESCCYIGGTLPDQNAVLSIFISHCICWV